jgi:hypothetical protein
MLQHHIAALRKVPCLKGSRFRVIVECNMSDMGQGLCHQAVSTFSDVDIVCETDHAYGVWTPPGIKQTYVFRTRKLMRLEAISFHSHIVSACPYQANMTQKELAKRNREKLEHQFRTFRAIVHKQTSLYAQRRTTYTGKANERNEFTNALQDDLAVILPLGISKVTDLLSDPPLAFLRNRTNSLR